MTTAVIAICVFILVAAAIIATAIVMRKQSSSSHHHKQQPSSCAPVKSKSLSSRSPGIASDQIRKFAKQPDVVQNKLNGQFDATRTNLVQDYLFDVDKVDENRFRNHDALISCKPVYHNPHDKTTTKCAQIQLPK